MGLKENLGLQNVRIEGMSTKTHFAQVLVEADYRMKLIGIGLEKPPVKIRSYVSRANPRSVSRNALQRWYFTPNYDCVRMSPDELAMELEGDGVQADQRRPDGAGRRRPRGRPGPIDLASQAFVKNFTEQVRRIGRAWNPSTPSCGT